MSQAGDGETFEGPQVRDARRGYCFQTHRALDLIRESFVSTQRLYAIGVYTCLTEAANLAGGYRARDGFEVTRKALAERMGISVDTLDRYLARFQELGLVEVEHRRIGAVNLPNVYVLLDPPDQGSPAPPSRTGEATPSRTGAALRARDPGSSKKENQGPKEPLGDHLAGAPTPKLVRVEGRNLAIDALAAECALRPEDPSYGQLATYLNGRAPTLRQPRQNGIADLAWLELTEEAANHPDGPERLDELREHPEDWQALLSAMIVAKADKYRAHMGPEVLLTAKALRDWWLRLERMPLSGRSISDAFDRLGI